jgi:hypothetical protein
MATRTLYFYRCNDCGDVTNFWVELQENTPQRCSVCQGFFIWDHEEERKVLWLRSVSVSCPKRKSFLITRTWIKWVLPEVTRSPTVAPSAREMYRQVPKGTTSRRVCNGAASAVPKIPRGDDMPYPHCEHCDVNPCPVVHILPCGICGQTRRDLEPPKKPEKKEK